MKGKQKKPPSKTGHVRYYFIPVRMAVIKKTTNNKRWQECGEREPQFTDDRNIIGTATKEKSMEFSGYLSE